MIQASERLIESNDGYTFVFLMILFSFIVAKMIYGKQLIFTNSFLFTSAHILKDDKESALGLHVIMLFIGSLTFGLLLFLTLKLYAVFSIKNPEILFLYISSGVFLYLLISNLLGRLLGELLGVRELVRIYLVFKVSYLKTIVLFLLPLLLLVIYSPVYQIGLLKITVACTLVLFVLRMSLILRNNKNLILNELFYFILYLCTLEIAPLIIILRLTI
ncbi:MAG: hypothetical protein COB60_01950 [Flavobacteriaceae bacterium]|nr:MAG: hypothetical protein COB60_01950 [Flavobacteriaceae bacterium]